MTAKSIEKQIEVIRDMTAKAATSKETAISFLGRAGIELQHAVRNFSFLTADGKISEELESTLDIPTSKESKRILIHKNSK